MSKIKNAFQNGKAFIAFLTAGDPSADKTVEYILDMEEAGADLVEIGIPFSDPTAEGVVIQEANIRALKAGMTTDGVFDIVRRVREKSQIPLVFLTYLNPVFHYGYDAFFEKCRELSVDGIIIPDLPFEEKGELAPIAASNGVDLISKISPTSGTYQKDCGRRGRLYLYCIVHGCDRCAQSDHDRSFLYCKYGAQSNKDSLCGRLRNQHSGTGGKNGCRFRRGHCGQRYCKDNCGQWCKCRRSSERICTQYESGSPGG